MLPQGHSLMVHLSRFKLVPLLESTLLSSAPATCCCLSLGSGGSTHLTPLQSFQEEFTLGKKEGNSFRPLWDQPSSQSNGEGGGYIGEEGLVLLAAVPGQDGSALWLGLTLRYCCPYCLGISSWLVFRHCARKPVELKESGVLTV